MAYVDIVYRADPATGFLVFDANGYPIQDPTANAGANTYGDLQAKIKDEILGSPTVAQIKSAIQDAIATFEGMQFWFTDIRYYGGSTGSTSALNTAQGKEVYGGLDVPMLASMPYIRNVQLIAFSNRYSLNDRTIQWIDDQSVSQTWQGMPTDLARSGGVGFRLYPVPNQTYPLIIDGTIRLPPLVEDTDFSPWTNRAEALIRQEAKRLLFTNITRNIPMAQVSQAEVQAVYARLRRESTMRGGGGGGKLRPSRGYL